MLHVRGSEEVEKIGEYTVEEEVKYLGIQQEGKRRDIFREENMASKSSEKSKQNHITGKEEL